MVKRSPPQQPMLSAGDLDGMDAGQLREHLLASATRGWSGRAEYHEAVAERIAALTGIDVDDIIDDAIDEWCDATCTSSDHGTCPMCT